MHFLSLMVHSDIFAITFAVLTIYTLFAPNILLVFGLSTEHTAPVAILNTVVLGFFVLECILSCIFMNGYLRSGRVFLDIMAMVSLVGDTLIQAHFFPMTPIAQPSMETSQLDPSRPSRILDILKFARLFRIVQRLGQTSAWVRRCDVRCEKELEALEVNRLDRVPHRRIIV